MDILITNVFGIKNKGDQALFECLRESLNVVQGKGPTRLAAVATNPDDNKAVYGEIKWVGLPWTSLFTNKLLRKVAILTKAAFFLIFDFILGGSFSGLAKEVKRADLVLASPGGYLEDSTWSYFAHLFQLLLCVRHGKALILSPQSLGPMQNFVGRKLTKLVLSHARAVFCRDQYSLEFCYQLFKEIPVNVFKTTDMVVVSDKLSKHGLVALTGVIGMTVLDWGCGGDSTARQNYIKVLKEVVLELELKGRKVMLIPQTSILGNPDMEVAQMVQQGTKAEILTQPESLDEFLAHFRRIDVIVGMRLHSCLLALMCGVPAISISYLPKCWEIMRDLGLSDFVIDVKTIELQRLLVLVSSLENPAVREDYWNRFESSRVRLKSDFNRVFENRVSEIVDEKDA